MASIKNLDEFAREAVQRAVEEITICGHPFMEIVGDIVQGQLIYRRDVLDEIANHERRMASEDELYNLAHKHLGEVVQRIAFPPEGERPICGPEKCDAARRYGLDCAACFMVRKEGRNVATDADRPGSCLGGADGGQ